MASIGELTATVRADVSGFVGPMRQVVTTTQNTASAVQSITAPTRRWQELLNQTATSGDRSVVTLTSLRGSLASLTSTMAGVPGPLGNIASKLAMLSLGGGATVAVLAGLAAITAAFNTTSEAAQKQADTIESLSDAYDEATGRAHRMRLALAQAAVAAANADTHLGIEMRRNALGVPYPVLAQVRDMGAVAQANRALLEAERQLAEFEENRAKPARQALVEATKAYQRSLEETEQAVKSSKDKGEANTAKKVENLTKEARAWMELKAQITATVQAEEERRNRPVDKSDVKLEAKETFEGATQGARDAAQAMSQAFMSAFSANKESLAERITNVLRSAVQDAVQRLIAQKLFDVFLKAFSPDKGVITGGGGVGDIVGGIFGAPPPMAAGTGTIIVPLDALPPALSPVEVARDAMHQAVWMETARVAEGNGFRLQPRFR